MKSINRTLYLALWIGLLHPSALLAAERFKSKMVERAKLAIVRIEKKASLKAYGDLDRKASGTGCIVDKSQGIVLTNGHIVDPVSISTYHLTFHNGQVAEAKLLYCDPWIDYAFLKVVPEHVPKDATEIEFSSHVPKVSQDVFMIGNNEGKSFSMHTGTVSRIHEVGGAMAQQDIEISLNTAGGSSGSPVLDQRGQAVGLNYAGSTTFSRSVHPDYIRYALNFIKKKSKPIRKHIGVTTAAYSLNDAARFRNFPRKRIEGYIRKFPTSHSNAIRVANVLPGSPAQGKLYVGDILWAINGKDIGPDLTVLDMAMNQTKASQVCLTICREGVWMDIEIPLYDLEDHTVKRMVNFGGALFFEADDVWGNKTGVLPGTVTFSNAQGSSTFSNVEHITHDGGGMVMAIELLKMDNRSVGNLDQLIRMIPAFIQKRYFSMDYVSVFPYRDSLSPLFGYTFSKEETLKADVEYDKNAPEPKIFIFNSEKMEWEGQQISTQFKPQGGEAL